MSSAMEFSSFHLSNLETAGRSDIVSAIVTACWRERTQCSFGLSCAAQHNALRYSIAVWICHLTRVHAYRAGQPAACVRQFFFTLGLYVIKLRYFSRFRQLMTGDVSNEDAAQHSPHSLQIQFLTNSASPNEHNEAVVHDKYRWWRPVTDI